MSDDAPTWDAVAHALAAAAGVEPRMVHVPSDAIATADPVWGAGPLGDKAHPMVFDTAELRRVVPDFVATVPFEQGAREVVAWHNEDPARQRVDERKTPRWTGSSSATARRRCRSGYELCGNPRLRPPWLGSSQRLVTTLPRVKK